jgi:hypothetical protein
MMILTKKKKAVTCNNRKKHDLVSKWILFNTRVVILHNMRVVQVLDIVNMEEEDPIYVEAIKRLLQQEVEVKVTIDKELEFHLLWDLDIKVQLVTLLIIELHLL